MPIIRFLNGSNSAILSEETANPAYDPNNPNSPKTVKKYVLADRFHQEGNISPTELSRIRHQSNGGWAPAFSATVNFTDHARAYLRYTETLRYPSIFEGTYAFPILQAVLIVQATVGSPNTPKIGKSAISTI